MVLPVQKTMIATAISATMARAFLAIVARKTATKQQQTAVGPTAPAVLMGEHVKVT
jgi:hypothetical protein